MACCICENLEAGDTLYASSDWDGGLGFDYIRNIQYCPVCGRKLAEQTEPQTEEWYTWQDEQEYNDRWQTEPQTDCAWK